jgi:hypothetical protein
MSKRISYRGMLDIGTKEKINLKTNNGKVGYKIVKFQIISTTPGTSAGTGTELIAQIFSRNPQSILSTVIFTDNTLLAVAYNKDGVAASDSVTETIIFDNEVFNQNIFITMTDQSGNSVPANYYLELEAMPINDLQATQLTLKSIKSVKLT